MAVETKIGLVVGLGFIVCFAMILSHRSRGDQLSSQVAYDLLSKHQSTASADEPADPEAFARNRSRSFPPSGQKGQRTDRRTNPRPSARAATTVGMTRLLDQRKTPARMEQSAATPRGAATIPQIPRKRKRPSFNDLFGSNESSTDGPQKIADPNAVGSGNDIVLPSLNERRDARKTTAPAKSRGRARESTNLQRNRSIRPPGGESRRYVVKPGDTLWKIAAVAYGTATKSAVDEVFEANRGVLSKSDALVAGMKLTLPPRGGSKTRTDADTDTPDVKQGGHRYYQVMRGDRYTTIAEKLLGSKSRWKEIHDLNRQIFPDPQRIKFGVRIRIPDQPTRQKG